MNRERQIELAARAAVGKAPGVQVAIQDTDTGFRIILDALLAAAGGERAYEQGQALLRSVGIRRADAISLTKSEWERTLLLAMTTGTVRTALHLIPAYKGPSCVPEHIDDDADTIPRGPVGHA